MAVPIIIYLLLVWAMHAPLSGDRLAHGVAIGIAAAATGLIAMGTSWGLPLPWAVLMMSLPPAALVAYGVVERHREHMRAAVA